jgi:uncharacterized protein (TIGR00369 family)
MGTGLFKAGQARAMTPAPEDETMDEIRRWVADSGYSRFLGMELTAIDAENATLRLPYREENSNPGDVLHGGCAASLGIVGGQAVARAALGAAAGSFHTAQLQVAYLAAARAEEVIATAKLRRRGKTLCFVDIDIATEAGKPVATVLTTVRGRLGAPPAETPTAASDESGTDPGEIGPFIEQQPFIANRRIHIEHMTGGTSRLSLPFDDEKNGDAEGGVHEGAVSALLDTCGAMASWATSGVGPYRASTVSLQSEALAPAPASELVAYGRCYHRDADLFWSDVEVAIADSRCVVSRGTVLYRIVTN